MNTKILVVDDEAHNLAVITDYLLEAEATYEVMEAANGQEALEIIAQETTPFDLVLTDWNMPVLDGLQLIKALKETEEYKEVPVIMQTANTNDSQLKQAFDGGAMDYIKKPVSQLELLARVRSALALSREKKKTEQLLLNILPAETSQELKETGQAVPKHYKLVSVLFTDFKGFTKIAESLSPQEVIEELNTCFLAFDEICERHKLEKIKTIGDAYMCAGGIPIANQTNPTDAVSAALEMQEWMERWAEDKRSKGLPAWEVRIGIHAGEVIAGVVGKKKFAYDIWGDTVNLASRMESSGEAGKVNISGEMYELIKNQYKCTFRGKVPVKYKGEIEMYFVEGKL